MLYVVDYGCNRDSHVCIMIFYFPVIFVAIYDIGVLMVMCDDECEAYGMLMNETHAFFSFFQIQFLLLFCLFDGCIGCVYGMGDGDSVKKRMINDGVMIKKNVIF